VEIETPSTSLGADHAAGVVADHEGEGVGLLHRVVDRPPVADLQAPGFCSLGDVERHGVEVGVRRFLEGQRHFRIAEEHDLLDRDGRQDVELHLPVPGDVEYRLSLDGVLGRFDPNVDFYGGLRRTGGQGRGGEHRDEKREQDQP
jgi:hypothetical protein